MRRSQKKKGGNSDQLTRGKFSNSAPLVGLDDDALHQNVLSAPDFSHSTVARNQLAAYRTFKRCAGTTKVSLGSEHKRIGEMFGLQTSDESRLNDLMIEDVVVDALPSSSSMWLR